MIWIDSTNMWPDDLVVTFKKWNDDTAAEGQVYALIDNAKN